MKLRPALLAALLATGCVSSPPTKRSPSIFPPAPTPVLTRAAARVTRQAVTPRSPVKIKFSYAPGESNYVWTLQISTNLVTWRDVAAPVIDGWVNITNTLPAAFYRMKGIR